MPAKDFYAFDVPPWLSEAHTGLSKTMQNRIDGVMEEIYSTPEGKNLLENAAKTSSDGKVRFVSNPNYSIAVTGGAVSISERDSDFQYLGKDGKLHDLSLPNLLVHELHHIASGQKPPRSIGDLLKNEEKTIKYVNSFMQKHYGEVERDIDSRKGSMKTGTPGWDDNPNFKGDDKFRPAAFGENPPPSHIKPDSFIGKASGTADEVNLDTAAPSDVRGMFSKMTEEQIADIKNPETQVLAQLRNHPEQFDEAFKQLKDQGSLSYVRDDMKSMQTDIAPNPQMEQLPAPRPRAFEPGL